MSLFKQVSILLSIVFVILFVLIVSISFHEMKESAQKSLYQNVQNSVSNISLSITNANADISTIKTVLSASFDNGNYEKILFKDLDEKILYERINKEEFLEKEIPSWFLNFVNIEEVSASSTLSKGWTVIGSIEIYANRDILYSQLYVIFINLITTLLITFIVFLAILFLLFKSILKPLKVIKNQSDSIMQNKFVIQEKMPFTSEFKTVTMSINIMVKKIESMFNNANEVLTENKELLYIDELTGLYNRRYLILKTSEYLEEDSINYSGFIVSILLTKIDLLNKKIGYMKTNKLFVNMAKVMNELVLTDESNVISRTNAAEFIIVLPRIKEEEVKNIAKELSKKLRELLIDIENEEIKLFVGVCNFDNENTLTSLLSKVDYTLCQSKTLQEKEYFYLENNKICQSRNNWRDIINNARENKHFNILFRDVIKLDTKEIIYKTISFEIKTEDRIYSYGEFIGPVIELNLLEELYLKIIQEVLNLDYKKKVSIQIPIDFLRKLPFEKLKELFNKKNNFNNIIFELEEESFIKYHHNTLSFITMIKKYGFDIAIFNFVGISDDYNYLKNKKIEYIKVNHNFLESAENMDALNIIRTSLDIELIATSVNSNEDLKFFVNKKINLIAGKITDKYY